MPSVAELIAALPEPIERARDALPTPLNPLLEAWSHRPVPVGRFRRLRMLGTLQAQIAAAYAFYWLRGWFKGADESKRLLAETHWRTAMRILDSMSYLRGAAMKVGQTLANFPDIVPREFVETFEKLHFTRLRCIGRCSKKWCSTNSMKSRRISLQHSTSGHLRPLPWARSIAARLKTGEEVAVKIQYPGIARTIREDIRNLLLCMLPGRLSRDWENTKEQFEDLRVRLERETDYEQEATSLERARALFREDDGIVVPRVYRQYSTARVLTMERLPGSASRRVSRDQSVAGASQRIRQKDIDTWYRMLFAGRMLYVDLHPGNFLFMDDGRLGVVDFGFMLELDDTLWELFRKMDRPLTTGRREDRIAADQRMVLDQRRSVRPRSRTPERGICRLELASSLLRRRIRLRRRGRFPSRRRFVCANGPQTLHPQPPLHAVDFATYFRLSIDLLPAEGEDRHCADCGRGSACDRMGPQRLCA